MPHTIFDVGAAYGEFTQTCSEVFPGAHYVLIEPLVEYQPYRLLDQTLSQVDIVFVPENGPFRPHHFYAIAGQRAQQTKQLRKQTK